MVKRRQLRCVIGCLTDPDQTSTTPVKVASPDDILIVAAGGMAYPTMWVMPSSLPVPPTVPVRAAHARTG